MSVRCSIPTLLVVSFMFSAVSVRADDELRECSLLPLRVGTEWVYAVGQVELVQRVTAHEEIGGEMCARLEASLNGQADFEHLTVRDDGIYRVTYSGQVIEPAFCVLKWPAEEGDEWTIDSSVQGQSLNGSVTLTFGEVTVPAGEFETVHVESEGFTILAADGTSSTLSLYSDYAEGVGMVRQVVRIGGNETTVELKEFTLPE
jgi:hypothetical protein